MNVSRVCRILEHHHDMMLDMLEVGSDDEHRYPFGQCYSSCLLVLPALRASEPECYWTVRVGYVHRRNYAAPPEWPDRCPHVWLFCTDGPSEAWVVDPTFGQFPFLAQATGSKEPFAVIDANTAFSKLGYVYHRILTDEQEDEARRRTKVRNDGWGRLLSTNKLFELLTGEDAA